MASILKAGREAVDRVLRLSDITVPSARQAFFQALGIESYASLAAANTGEGLHNVLFYNTTINKLQLTTSDS